MVDGLRHTPDVGRGKADLSPAEKPGGGSLQGIENPGGAKV